MDVGRFFSFTDEEALYFARVRELRERGTGGRPHAKETAVVSCWHEDELESVAMWKLYTSGPEGVAIQTTMADLRRVLSQARVSQQSRLYIVRVKYKTTNASPDKARCSFLRN